MASVGRALKDIRADLDAGMKSFDTVRDIAGVMAALRSDLRDEMRRAATAGAFGAALRVREALETLEPSMAALARALRVSGIPITDGAGRVVRVWHGEEEENDAP